jgi:hypothetical protein
MKRIIIAILSVLVSPLLASSQTQHFSLSGGPITYMGPSGSAPATIADGYFNVTKTFSAGYQQIIIPGLATAKLGMMDVSKPLASWLGKTLTAKLAFDSSKVSIDVFAGAGKLSQDVLKVNRIAEAAGVCVSYAIGANVSANVVCGEYLHGGIVNGLITVGQLPGSAPSASSSNAAVFSQLKVHF